MQKTFYITLVSTVLLLISCKKDPNATGSEYAPEMYHSRAYEPLSQITDVANPEYNSNPNNPYSMNMRVPAEKTVRIVKYSPLFGEINTLTPYKITIHKDSFELAGKILKSPIEQSEKNIASGKVLYERYCLHCHGETGQGDGPVGKIYKGVPSYSKGRVKYDTEGHIFHTITFGRNRMWSHASQISVTDRWKIVQYVQTLQNQE